MFIAVLITVVRIWKQPKCPKPGNWTKEVWYTMEYYLAKRKDAMRFLYVDKSEEYHAEQN